MCIRRALSARRPSPGSMAKTRSNTRPQCDRNLTGQVASSYLAAAGPAAAMTPNTGLRLDYDPHLRRVTATADLSRVAGRVRGGT